MIRLRVTFAAVDRAQLGAFRECAAQLVEAAGGEPGTLGFEWFRTEDERVFVLLETYADSDAVLAHFENVGTLAARLAELGGESRVEVFGRPSARLQSALEPADPTRFVPLSE